MKRTLKKRLGSIMLALCMVVAMLPAMTHTALAGEWFCMYYNKWDFGTVSEGYEVQSPKELEFKFYDFTGTLTGFTANLQADGSSAFEITEALSSDTITETDNILTISVRPKIGLTAGTYTDTLTVAYAGGSEWDSELRFVVSGGAGSIEPDDYTFTEQYAGYDNTSLAATFTLKNTGTGPLNGLSAKLEKGVDSSFVISTDLPSTTVDSNGTATVSVQPKSGLSAGTYKDTLNITVGTLVIDSAQLSFTVRPNPEITQQASDQSINTGGTATFTVKANGNPEPTYRWSVLTKGGSVWVPLSEGGCYSGTAAQTLTVTGVPGDFDGYQYRCEVSSGTYSISSNAATLTVTDGGTGTLSGTMDIGARSNIPLNVSRSGSGWSWNAATATLTLNSSYPSSERIEIKCDPSDNINLVLTGNVTVQEGSLFAFRCAGNLDIKAENYTLNLSTPSCALAVDGYLEIKSGTVVTTSVDAANGIQAGGDVTISGSANVTATSLGGDGIWGASGIASDGDVHITTSGKVDTSGHKNGIYADNGITISNGTVTAAGTEPAALIGESSGVTVTGGTLTTGGTYTPGHTNGDVVGRLTVSGAAARVIINGDIKHQRYWDDNNVIISPGDLTVFGGRVTVTGTVEGAITHTGGIFNGQKSSDFTYVIISKVAVTGGAELSGAVLRIMDGDLLVEEWTSGTAPHEIMGTLIAGETYTLVEVSAPAGYTVADPINFTVSTDGSIDKVEMVNAPTTNGGGSSGGGGGGGTPTTPAAGGTTEVSYTASNGTASLSLPTDKVKEIIEKAKGEAVIDLSKAKDVTAAELPKDALAAFGKEGLGVTLKLPTGTVTLDEDAAASVAKQAAGGNLNVELKKVSASSLTAAQQGAVRSGDLVLDINITFGGKKISTFDGKLTVQIPYTGKQPVAVWYLNDKGELKKLNCTFKNGVVTFTLDHLSKYVVGQDTEEAAWTNPFADVKKGDWFYGAVQHVQEKGLMNGTSNTTFGPHGTSTRGMIVTILYRLENSPAVSGANPFADVAAGKYYIGAAAWAAENKIVSGYGDGKFGPEDSITREQMAMILMNYAKVKGRDVSAKADLSKFTDAASVSGYARDAVAWANAAGLIQGDGAKLNPGGNAERAQVAAILQRFMTEGTK